MNIAPRYSLAALLLLAGCASAPRSPTDPLEPMNRVVYRFNTTLDKAVVKPVAQTYQNYVPTPLQTAVSNFFDNLHDVTSMVNNTLQGHPEQALNDLMRVALNSTFGLFGLLDIADPAGLKNYKTGFGDTLAQWGWKNSSYLVLPLFGPSTVRDGIGRAADSVTPPPHAFLATEKDQYAYYALDMIDRRVRLLGLETAVDEAALDSYAYTRDAYLQYRARQLGLAPANEDVNIDDLVGDDGAGAKKNASAPAAAAAPAKDASAAQ